MSSEESRSQVVQGARTLLNSGIIRVYLLVTVLSVVVITAGTGSIGLGLFWGGWGGLLFAILINELTPGFTMKESWIARRKI